MELHLLNEFPWQTAPIRIGLKSVHYSMYNFALNMGVPIQEVQHGPVHECHGFGDHGNLMLEFATYQPRTVITEIHSPPVRCHDYDCHRGITFLTEHENQEIRWRAPDESYFWEEQEVEFWHMQKDITLKKGRSVFMWCDSTFCTPNDWNTTRQTRYDLFQRKYPEQTFSCFRSEPQTVRNGVPMPPWTTERLLGYYSPWGLPGGLKVSIDTPTPITALTVLVDKLTEEDGMRVPRIATLSRLAMDERELEFWQRVREFRHPRTWDGTHVYWLHKEIDVLALVNNFI